jgi:hypothetical protein
MVGMLLVGMVPAIALAATITCGTSLDRDPSNVICRGTDNNDQITERKGQNQDDIRARAGNDTVDARPHTNDADTLHGQTGDDTLYANDGDTRDVVDCGQDTDTAKIDVKTDSSGKVTADKFDSDCETVKDQNGDPVHPAALPAGTIVSVADNG